jgi:hypothetical protein
VDGPVDRLEAVTVAAGRNVRNLFGTNLRRRRPAARASVDGQGVPMKARVRTQEVAEFSPFGDLAGSGARCVGLDPVLERGYAFSPDPYRTASFAGGAVALLRSCAGCFGWRVTGRQAAALVRTGFTCRSWA